MMVEARTDRSAPTARVRAAALNRRGSTRARAMPIDTIGPIKGEISIAPMITGAED